MMPDKKKSSLNVLNMLSGVNELCLLVKHASCDFRYRLVAKRCNLKQIKLSMWMQKINEMTCVQRRLYL